MASCTESHRIASAKQRASEACEAIASHYTLSLPHATEPNVQLLHEVLNAALAGSAGIEGGFRRLGAPRSGPPGSASEHAGGFLAYAFPSYPGSGIKRDIPEAETPLILSALTRIFEPFVGARPGGCGLVLPLVREIAASHGGTAYHAAPPTACFVIDIPWQPSY